jgi:hypothetical protein
MDTLKKEIYIEARAMLESGTTDFLCHALQSATCYILGTDDVSNDELSELFPEFFAMDDGFFWFDQHIRMLNPIMKGPCRAWWNWGWPEPRIAMIDYLLSR